MLPVVSPPDFFDAIDLATTDCNKAIPAISVCRLDFCLFIIVEEIRTLSPKDFPYQTRIRNIFNRIMPHTLFSEFYVLLFISDANYQCSPNMQINFYPL